MVFKVFWSPGESVVPHNSEKVLQKVCKCKKRYFLIDKQTAGGWMKTLWLRAELLCHYHLHYDPSLNAGIGLVTASSLALI